MQSKNDIAWEALFEKYQILFQLNKDGLFSITSTQINEFREARLMTKFDHRSHLPKLFSDNKLSILPTTRGTYTIAKFEAYSNFENKIIPISRIDFPESIQSIDYQNVTSESTALNCAFVAGILDDFLDEQNLRPTVSGRMSSGEFDFQISGQNQDLTIKVENAQIEIDGGYEGEKGLYLIEAKNSISKDFLIRQLYYPFRLWSSKIEKPVHPIFLTYSNGIFHFKKYKFTDPNHYNSIELIYEKRYAISQEIIKKKTILDLIVSVEIMEEPEIAFPQADSFERIINLCELIHQNGGMTAHEITSNYDFDKRQTSYYTDSTRYLGLMKKEKKEGKIRFFLTKKGKAIFKLPVNERQIEFAKMILSHKVFNLSLKSIFDKNRSLSKSEIVEIMKTCNLRKIDSESTFERRASTISRWNKWILELIEEPLEGDQLKLLF